MKKYLLIVLISLAAFSAQSKPTQSLSEINATGGRLPDNVVVEVTAEDNALSFIWRGRSIDLKIKSVSERCDYAKAETESAANRYPSLYIVIFNCKALDRYVALMQFKSDQNPSGQSDSGTFVEVAKLDTLDGVISLSADVSVYQE